ncbi:type II toxin-antitoxin system MqsA family antitoxin [Klebsiella michiganensis]|uniref:type II toxin-antitoxin system MqsA family antitoxin n=1 Tax=Klebsiella michiganensis TaxID=1134687 RepID=UPI0027395EC1|nr:type II toxin-antitoxin system MqsA family antitoxin [Klebsiella michiganensis]WLP18221.1 type II toxin-antitoxin system MqsA family antitoxin [Klebsiella michiganensis]
MRNNNICPVCGAGHLTVEMDYDDVTYKGVTKNLPARFSVCDECGSESATPVDLRENKRIFNEFKKSVEGLVTGRELKRIRTEVWCITQEQAASIFGGGPKAFSKYESDDVIQSEAMDKLIRLAADIPEAFLKLRELSGETVVEKTVTVSKYLPIWRSEDTSRFESDELEQKPNSSHEVSFKNIIIRTVSKQAA